MILDGDPEDEEPTLEMDEEPEEAPVETDEDEPVVEDEDETEAQPEREPEEDPLPDDPVELKRIARERGTAAKEAARLAERFERIAVGAEKPQTPAAKPKPAEDEDEFAPHLDEAYRLLASQEDPDPKVLKRALLALTGMVVRTKQQRAADRQEQERERLDRQAEALVPTKHRAKVDAITEQFKVPKVVAWQLVKGDLYDAALQKGKTAKQAPTKETPAASPRGAAKGTSFRPVPPQRSGEGGSVITLSGGEKVRAEYTPEGYAKLMDGLEAQGKTAARREILRLRSENKIKLKV